MQTIDIDIAWQQALPEAFFHLYRQEIDPFLRKELQQGKVIYPINAQYFRALKLTPFNQIKVIIIGQDPYHGKDQANGLAFSVARGVPLPPSLVNIYKELHSDLAISPVAQGCLESWAQQGVLLLNSVLTVEHQKAASHKNKGWERLTDAIIQALLCKGRAHYVFILWGGYAQRKCRMIDTSQHLVIRSAHPSPLSSYRGFFGSRPFSRANAYLNKHDLGAIDWSLLLND